MNDWEHLFGNVGDKHREMLNEARQARLAQAASAPTARGSRLRIMLLTLTIILLGMIAWWGH